jgi:putative ABC transport system permease protein
MAKYLILFQDAIAELLGQKLRTFLTMLGMIFGVGSVIAMLNIGQGAENEALKLIDSMGVNNIIVNAKRYDKELLSEIREESLGLNLGDVKAALATLPFVEGYSASKNIDVYDIYSDFKKSQAQALGVTVSYFANANMQLSAGRFLTTDDDNKLAQFAVLGSNTAQQLFLGTHFNAEKMLGQYIKINHVWLEIVGVLKAPAGNKNEFQGVQIGGDRYRIFVPLSVSVQKFSSDILASELDSIKLNIAKGTDPVVAAKAIDRLITLRHGGLDDYSLVIPAALLEQQKQTQQIFNIVMACVAGISLLERGIGIMNIMLANVMERTKEIGLLRAVGATQDDIRQQFIAESFTISVMGGLLGIFFGLVLSEIIGFYSGWAVSWSGTAIILSMSICMFVGVGFGVFPAIKASKLNPIDALHSD